MKLIKPFLSFIFTYFFIFSAYSGKEGFPPGTEKLHEAGCEGEDKKYLLLRVCLISTIRL
jgi:hypothetical protein